MDGVTNTDIVAHDINIFICKRGIAAQTNFHCTNLHRVLVIIIKFDKSN